MGRITSSVGLITGIPIEETVKKLMAVSARPRDLLTARNADLTKQQTALDTLGSRLLAFQFAVNKLKGDTVYASRQVTSSDDKAVAATAAAGATPAVGSYQVHPVRAASAQTLVSQTFESLESALDDGILRLGFGGFVDASISLDQLNGGAGFQRGKIRITDRAGDVATIDLRHARTVDDVLQAINSNDDVAVTASVEGDQLVLTDGSGGTGNLIVKEVGGGTTAASLGLAGISVAADSASGADILRLHSGTKLAALNDGNGVRLTPEDVSDLEITLADGTELTIDLSDEVTLGDVLSTINAVNPAKLSATIAADGNRLELTDLSGGPGDLTVESGAVSHAAEDLGIAGSGAAGTLAGRRLISGLKDSLLARLNGGAGIGPLGVLDITDRNGGSDSVDLSEAETLRDVINLINASAADVTASFNAARNGIVVVDDSGGLGDLTIASGDATNSAEALGLDVDGAVGQSNSGALHRQTLSETTLLSSLNGGKGASIGDIQLVDAAGIVKTVDLNPTGNEAKTVGDVIDRINALTNGVEARINDAGNGILITNTATGSGSLTIKDLSGDVARSLNLTRASTTIEVDGVPTQVIDGARSYAVDLSDLEFSARDVTLASLNGGSGVAAGDFLITDSRGRSIAVDLNGADAGVATIGQLVDLINSKANAAGLQLTASINASNTGISLTDASNGSEKLKVTDVNSTAAADLKLTRASFTSNGAQVVDGVGAFSTDSNAQSGLQAIAARINDLKAGITASTVFDGAGYRLSLSVNATGDANQLLVDAGGTGIAFDQVKPGQDALLLFGDLNAPGGGVLLSSPDGAFNQTVAGVNLSVLSETAAPVTVNVTQTDASLVAAVKDIVAAYNALRKDLGSLTSFDAENLTTGLLFGTNEALQVDQRLSRVLTDRYFGTGDFQSLSQIGITVNGDGTLEVNSAKLSTAYAEDPEAIKEFLTNSQNGVVTKLNNAVESLAGADGSLLANRSDALKDTLKANQDRIEALNASLDRQQERLFLQFSQLEEVIARLQTSLAAISNLQPIAPLTSSRK